MVETQVSDTKEMKNLEICELTLMAKLKNIRKFEFCYSDYNNAALINPVPGLFERSENEK